jgi:adenylosuccinate synthase
VGLTDESELPEAARSYLRFLEQAIGVPIVLVSTGPRREETMIRGDHPIAKRFAEAIAKNPGVTA